MTGYSQALSVHILLQENFYLIRSINAEYFLDRKKKTVFVIDNPFIITHHLSI